jgi:hypothetical protein
MPLSTNLAFTYPSVKRQLAGFSTALLVQMLPA